MLITVLSYQRQNSNTPNLDLMDCYIKTLQYQHYCLACHHSFNPWFDGLLYKDQGIWWPKRSKYIVSTLDLMDCYIKTLQAVCLQDVPVVSTLDLMDCYIKTIENHRSYNRSRCVSTLDLMDCYIKTATFTWLRVGGIMVSTLDLMDCYIKTKSLLSVSQIDQQFQPLIWWIVI